MIRDMRSPLYGESILKFFFVLLTLHKMEAPFIVITLEFKSYEGT